MGLMSMKVLAALSDLGSTPSSSTRGHGFLAPSVVVGESPTRVSCFGPLNQRELLIVSVSSGGAVKVSSGSIVGTGDITVDDYRVGIAGRTPRSTGPSEVKVPTSKRSDEQRKPTIAKPMTMAAAA